MLTKMKVLQTITRLPDKFSLDELMGEIKMLEEIEKNLSPFNTNQNSEDQKQYGATQWFG